MRFFVRIVANIEASPTKLLKKIVQRNAEPEHHNIGSMLLVPWLTYPENFIIIHPHVFTRNQTNDDDYTVVFGERNKNLTFIT